MKFPMWLGRGQEGGKPIKGNGNLYNVLSQMTGEFYDWNNQNKNRAMYQNRGMYTPGVVFMRDPKRAVCDVITCAGNYRAFAQVWGKIGEN